MQVVFETYPLRMWAPLIMLILAVFLVSGSAAAENIDPLNDDSQFAWSENSGWINAEPSGDGGVGVTVTDFGLTGWMWGEHIGWINLSCQNRSTCDLVEYGVRNDGAGNLSGYAWGEHVGWINFAPATGGVSIDLTTGDFSGRAWGEEVGWITFASEGDNPYKVKTAWNCNPLPPAPSGSPALDLARSVDDALLSWSGLPGATAYDIVRGDLTTLRDNSGDFSLATQECLENNGITTSLLFSGTPASGEGFWFLVRGLNCGEGSGLRGTYDSGGGGQAGSRDAEIGASGNDCP